MRILSLIILNSGIILFILNWILDRELNWKSYYISDFANSRHGYLTSTGFITLGIGSLLTTNFPKTTNFIEIELLFYGILLVLLGIFPVDVKGEVTWKGVIHSITAHLCFNSFFFSFIIYIIFNYPHAPLYMIFLIFLIFLSAILLLLLPQKHKGFFQRGIILNQIVLLQILIIDGKLFGIGI